MKIASNTLWIATINNGLYAIKLKDNQIIGTKHFQHDKKNTQSLSNNKVFDIIHPQVYDTTALWIATTSGLNRFDLETEKFTHLQEIDGINSDYIAKILEDNDGNLWFTTTAGLTKYNIKTKIIRNYDIKDGLPTTRFYYWKSMYS